MLKYISFSNNEGKNWVLPTKNVRTALEIYQPAGWKGKLIKKVLPYSAPLRIIPIPYTILSLEKVIPAAVMQKIQECFGSDAEYSYFAGTPGTHKKPTVQVFKGKSILGYVKYTIDPEIIKLFKNEETILEQLKVMGVNNVPRCLFCDKVKDYTIFIQDSKKKRNAKIEHEYGKLHEQFMSDLKNRTKRDIPFSDTQFKGMLDDLLNRLDKLEEKDQKIVKMYTRESIEYHRNDRQYAVCHRDFTPWNTCLVDGMMYVFDWEYARMTYPVGLDKARFIVEVERRENHKTPDEIVRNYSGDKRPLIDYIIDNLYIYLKRGRESDKEEINFNLKMLKALE